MLSLDALIAIGLVLLLAIFLSSFGFSSSSPELTYQRLYYGGKDVLNVIKNAKLSNLQDFEIVQDYLEAGVLVQDDMNKSLLDIIGSFWASGNVSYAENLTKGILGKILNETKCSYELRMDGDSVYKIDTPVNYLARLTTIVSGYAIGKPVSGSHQP